MVVRRPATTVLAWVALAVVTATLASCSGGSDDAPPAAKAATTTVPAEEQLKLNQIQAIGTHNSFHVAATPKEHEFLVDLNPQEAATRTYSHPSITDQMAKEKIRQLEFDVFADSHGGLYANPAFRARAAIPAYVMSAPAMAQPGTKVFHEQDVDYHTVCLTLIACLSELKVWSDANPDHVPVAVNIQFKDGPLIFDVANQKKPEPWNTAAMDGLDREIASVFTPEEMITPDDVRGKHKTLEEAVLAGEWPTLAESRGKVLFLMINPEPYRSIYLSGHPGLKDRILFTNAKPGQPDASYVGVDDPVKDSARIDDLVKKGYLVRTRADEPGKQGRTGDTSVRDAALASGAQWISTDYPGPDGAKKQYGTDYKVELPGFLAARCNPVTAPKGCEDANVEP